MLIKVLKSKIHRATVTDALIDYPGSIGIDSALMEASGLVPYELVLVADTTNGARLETYVVPEAAGSGKVQILGAAAKLMNKGDIIIIMSFGLLSPEDARHTKPKVVIANEKNGIKEIQ
ncbi:MAG TPA: aspartate 1-decarboxylase [Phycisphaerales bacterium]|jgi:aspartate 1-decarboxylase|nr:MAG: aspartate 1-decarboxylase [Planctomycetes bacterium GWC2_45_44]HBG79070.1 aspartate 1-decarboxylase [Phycisphaerales bacterium]HBR19508.1 aspartate 1-decarboxylase [Phycisphaerales bacterium]